MQIKTGAFVKNDLIRQVTSNHLTDDLCPLGVNMVLGDAAAGFDGRPLEPTPPPPDAGPRKGPPPADARAEPPEVGVRADDEYPVEGRYCTLGVRGLYDDPGLVTAGAALLVAG